MDVHLLSLALILVAAEIGGYVTDRLGLTRVAGQIAAGLVLGPSVLNLVHPDANVELLASVGALCVLTIAGLETDLTALRSVGRAAMLAALGGVALPLALGYLVAMVAASLGLSHGILDERLYAAAVVTALVSTVVTPVLLSMWAKRAVIASRAAEGMAAAVDGVTGRAEGLTPVHASIALADGEPLAGG
jgi:Na+:H+ antiporter